MDYRKAQQLKNKGLLSLIAEKKFEKGQGIGASVGGAISEKFKAKVTRTKERFDPLNILSTLVGTKNVFGRSITTAAGRAFGRTEEDIGYFGGYRRKGGKRKDPRRTTIGPGPIKALKIGDSTADILAKMYNFMEKTHEREIKRYELEKSFREEQMEEDERRHKKLIDELIKNNKKKDLAKEVREIDTGNTWIDKMLDGMKAALAFVLKPFKFIFGVLKNLGNFLKTIAGGLGTIIFDILKEFAEDIVGSILVSPLTKLIKSIVSDSFKLLVSSLGSALSLIPGLGTAIKAVLLALAAGSAEIAYLNELFDLQTGEDVKKLDEAWNEYQRERYQEIEDLREKLKNQGSDEDKKKIMQMIIDLEKDIAAGSKKRIEVQRKKRNLIIEKGNELIPKMAEQGFKPKIDPKSKTGDYQREPDGRLKFFDDKGNQPGLNEYAKAISGKSFIDMKKDELIDEQKQRLSEAKTKIVNKAKTLIEENLPNLLPAEEKPENKEPDIIINGSTNNIGGASGQTQDTTPILSRDINISFINRMNYVPV